MAISPVSRSFDDHLRVSAQISKAQYEPGKATHVMRWRPKVIDSERLVT